MRYSPESLEAFVQTVSSGSFSAAARALGKSQSTISTAIAGLEDDLGFKLFDRSGRQPILTDQGRGALAQVQQPYRFAAGCLGGRSWRPASGSTRWLSVWRRGSNRASASPYRTSGRPSIMSNY